MKYRLLASITVAVLSLTGCGTHATTSSGNGTASGNASTSGNASALGNSSGGNTAATTTSAPVKIQLWESHSGGPVAKTQSALVKQFNASHKNIKVSLYITHASAKALAAVTSGKPPLVAEISHYIGKYVNAKALTPWTKVAQSGSVQTFWPAVKNNSWYNGTLYRYPADVKVSELFYNKSLFQKAGISSTPKTWTELEADLVKLKALGVIPMGYKDSSAHILSPFISNGGQLFANSAKTKVQFDNSAGKTTFNYFRMLYHNKDMIFSHGNQMRADFGADKMAIVDGTSAGYQKILAAAGGKFKVGAFPLPAGTTGHIGNLVQGLGFVLFAGNKKIDQRAAWTFVHWFNEPKQQAYWAMHSGFDPTTPAGAAAIPKAWLSKNPGESVSINILKTPYVHPRPVPDSYAEVQSALDTAFYNAVTGKVSVSSALQKLDKQANGYLSGKTGL